MTRLRSSNSVIFIIRLRSNASVFAFAFDEQVTQLRTLFQLFQTLVYICVLTVNKTIFTKKDNYELVRLIKKLVLMSVNLTHSARNSVNTETAIRASVSRDVPVYSHPSP